MMQQIYPSVTHPYQFELNKDFNFSAATIFPVKMQEYVYVHMVILILLI